MERWSIGSDNYWIVKPKIWRFMKTEISPVETFNKLNSEISTKIGLA